MTAALRFAAIPDRRLPSAHALGVAKAGDELRAFVDQLCIDHRLTSAEIRSLLAGEHMRADRSDLEHERATGNAVPLCLRYIKPATDDARVAEAGAIIDGITDAALHG